MNGRLPGARTSSSAEAQKVDTSAKAAWCLGLAFSLLFLSAARAAERVIDFTQIGALPEAGFRSAVTGAGAPGQWQILQDDVPSAFSSLTGKSPVGSKQSVVAQVSKDQTDEHFPLLIFDGQSFDDFRLTTHIKMVSGGVEQMAGIAFRLLDEQNYYVVRASALGNTFRFYKFVNGQRSQPIGPEIRIASNVWHELTIECQGNNISCLLNGRQAIPTLTDNSFAEGKIAFWTKSDAVSYFGRTTIVYTPKKPQAQTIVDKVLRDNPRLRGLTIYARTKETPPLRVVGTTDPKEAGQPGGAIEQDVLARDAIYFGKNARIALVTFPLHDRNGEPVGLVRVALESFKGQTQQNAIARARLIVRQVEANLRSAEDLIP